MPNPVSARYTVQLGPTVTPEVGGELGAWAELLGNSMSEVARECIDAGLEQLRNSFRQRAIESGRVRSGALIPSTALLRKHVAAARERGDRQVKRRRNYDERTRKVGPVNVGGIEAFPGAAAGA